MHIENVQSRKLLDQYGSKKNVGTEERIFLQWQLKKNSSPFNNQVKNFCIWHNLYLHGSHKYIFQQSQMQPKNMSTL
jgi:hypothetical protein